jgi:hypothetical protein
LAASLLFGVSGGEEIKMPVPALREPWQIKHDCAAKLKRIRTSRDLTAILGWLLGGTSVSSRIEQLRITSDHRLLVRMEEGVDLVAAEMDLIHNVHGVAKAAGFDGDELGYLLAQVAKIKRRR